MKNIKIPQILIILSLLLGSYGLLIGVSIAQTRTFVISNVEVKEVRNPRAYVVWKTDVESNSKVVYGTESSDKLIEYKNFSHENCNTSGAILTLNHCVVLRGLSENTTYYYRVVSTNASGEIVISHELQFNSGPYYTTTSGGFSLESTSIGTSNSTETSGSDSVVTSSDVNNTTTTTVDTTPPVITILGDNPVHIQKDSTYVDAGVEVSDNIDTNLTVFAGIDDGDINLDISAISLDTSHVGSHTIKYKATDSSGNHTLARRGVNIYEPETATEEPNTSSDVTSSEGTQTSTEASSETPLVQFASDLNALVETFTEPFNDTISGLTSTPSTTDITSFAETLTTQSTPDADNVPTHGVSITQPDASSILEGTKIFSATTTESIKQVVFKIINRDGLAETLEAHLTESTNWSASLDSKALKNGVYLVVAYGKYSETDFVRSDKRAFYVRNQKLVTNTQVPTLTTQVSTSTTIHQISSDFSTTSPHVANRITWACREANITKAGDCLEFMFRKNLPKECQQQLVTSPEDCDRIIRETKLTQECKTQGIESERSCKEYMETLRLPEECRDAGVSTAQECEALVFEKTAPSECLDAGIGNKRECEKYIFNLNLPQICKDNNIQNIETCKKYILNENQNSRTSFIETVSKECEDSDISSRGECVKNVQEKYLPNECKEKGINTELDCKTFLNQRHIKSECVEAGITNRESCDALLFEKNLPKECAEAGITELSACKEYSFSLYKSRISCDNPASSGVCEESVKVRHIGNLISTQKKFDKLKAISLDIENVTKNIEDLREILGEEGSLVPIVGVNRGIRIIRTEDSIVLNQNDELVQTSPVALMLDSDNDGLTDDFEKRIGTNPLSADTDNDGQTDIEELRSDNDPNGEGSLVVDLAPVEVALLNDIPLEHPKTSGLETENLEIEAVVNKTSYNTTSGRDEGEGTKNSGYLFNGLAEAYSVVTLYIYSDLPLVVTIQTDRYGNWQYELDSPLIDGEHEVYVAINDNTGKVVEKSKPINFFVREAEAFSVNEYLSSVNSRQVDDSRQFTFLYIVIALLVAVVSILTFVLFLKEKNKKEPETYGT